MSVNLLCLKTSDVYLNASLGKLLTNLSRLELVNWKLSTKIKCLRKINATYFSMLFGVALVSICLSSPFLFLDVCFLAISPISCLIKWLSYRHRLWRITGILISSTFNLKWLTLQSWSTDPFYVLTCTVTVVSYSDISLLIWSTSNMTLFSYVKFFFIFKHFQWSIKMLSCYFFYSNLLLLTFFYEYMDRIFFSLYFNRLTVFIIITTHNFVTISTTCMFLVCFCMIHYCLLRMGESFLFFLKNLHRWQKVQALVCENYWILLCYCLFRNFYCLLSIHHDTVSFVSVKYLFTADTL